MRMAQSHGCDRIGGGTYFCSTSRSDVAALGVAAAGAFRLIGDRRGGRTDRQGDDGDGQQAAQQLAHHGEKLADAARGIQDQLARSSAVVTRCPTTALTPSCRIETP